MENIKEINLAEIMSALLRRLWLIVLCAVLAGALMYGYTANFITEMYKSRITVYVNNTVVVNESTAYNITASDLATSQRLVLTYINILKSDRVLDEVAAKVGRGVSAAYIRGMMTAAALDETEVFEVVISSSDPKLAHDIAKTIGEVAPDIIGEIVSGSSTSIIDWPKVATAPYAPNRNRNTAIGMIVGAVLAVCVVVLQTLLDVRVKSEDDLANISGAPVLGLIPDLAMESKDQYGYSGYKYSAYKAGGSSKDGGSGV